MSDEICSLRGLIAEARLKRQDIAELMGLSEAKFSRYINERRTAPPGFTQELMKAIDLLKKAESAAQEAREKVLAQDENKTENDAENDAEDKTRELVPADTP